MSGVTVLFSVGNVTIGEMQISLECFDSGNHTIPENVLHIIRNSHHENVQLFFIVNEHPL